MSPRRFAWAEIMAAGLAFAVRVQGLAFQSLWRDEVDSWRFSSQSLVDVLKQFVMPGQNGPLYYLLLKAWRSVAGESEFSLRLPSAFAGALVAPLICRLVARVFPGKKNVGILASLLAATSPYLVWYSQEARMYSAVVCAVLASTVCFLTAIQSGGWRWWAGYSLAMGVGIYLHFVAALAVPAQFLILVILYGHRNRGVLQRYLVALGVLAVLYLPLLRWQLPRVLSAPATGYDFVPLGQMLTSLALSYTGGVLEHNQAWGTAFSLCLLTAAFLIPTRERLARPLAALAAWLCVPVAGFFLLTLVQPMFTARYLVFVVPALLVLVATGACALGRRARWLSVTLLVALLVCNGVTLRKQATTAVKADYRSATRYVVARMGPEDGLLFEIPYGKYAFEYYRSRVRASQAHETVLGDTLKFFPLIYERGTSARWIDGPYTNGGMLPNQVSALMTQLIGDCKVVWFIASEQESWDRRGLVQNWLDAHAVLTTKAEFTRVVVARYMFPRN